MSESLVDKWRKIPLGAGAVVAGMCADELAARDAEIRKHAKQIVRRSSNHDIVAAARWILALLDGQPEESTPRRADGTKMNPESLRPSGRNAWRGE